MLLLLSRAQQRALELWQPVRARLLSMTQRAASLRRPREPWRTTNVVPVAAVSVCAGAAGALMGWRRYDAHNRNYEARRGLFEDLLRRYKTGTAYTQFLIRGVLPGSPSWSGWSAGPVPKAVDAGDLPFARGGPDMSLDARLAMVSAFDAQPAWVRSVQRWRRRDPVSSKVDELDETWIGRARKQLYQTAPNPSAAAVDLGAEATAMAVRAVTRRHE